MDMNTIIGRTIGEFLFRALLIVIVLFVAIPTLSAYVAHLQAVNTVMINAANGIAPGK